MAVGPDCCLEYKAYPAPPAAVAPAIQTKGEIEDLLGSGPEDEEEE